MRDEPTANSAVERTLLAIKDLIRENQLKLGDAIPTETSLAKQFGMSRNTVREAIRTLKAYGIVESRQKTGAILTDNRQAAMMKVYSFGFEVSEETFTEIQGFRRLLEEGIADAVLDSFQLEDLDVLRTLTAEMESATDPIEASQHDFKFHRHLIGLGRNAIAVDVYDTISPVVLQLMENGKSLRIDREEVANQHYHIIDAIAARSSNAYIYWVRTHLQSGLKFLTS